MTSERKFHWRLTQGGERHGASRGFQASLADTGKPDLEQRIRFCRRAEELGIDSLLTDFGWSKPDPMILASALGLATERIKFIIAYRSGLICPTSFVQQLNTLSTLIDGRFSINVIAGDTPEEQRYFDGKYYRVAGGRINTPFTAPDRDFPELFIAGNSTQARDLAVSQGTIWMQIPNTPEAMRERGAEVLAAGKELGVRCSIIGGRTRGEALRKAYALISE